MTPEREALLAFGALMLLRNGEYISILPLVSSKDEVRKGLADDWNIIDGPSARHNIQQLILEGRRGRYESDFRQLQEGASLNKLSELSGEDVVRWERARKLWSEQGMPPSSTTSPAAYDYERIAYLARTCLYLDYLTETEAWRCLAWVAKQSRKEFGDWGDYAASFVFGRAATFSQNTNTLETINTAKALLTEHHKRLGRPHVWQRYPLATISVPADLALSDVTTGVLVPQEDTSQQPVMTSARKPLLGLGALIAASNGEPLNTLKIPEQGLDTNVNWLANARNIADTHTALAQVDWLLATGNRDHHEHTFRRIAQGAQLRELENVPAAAYLSFQQAREQLTQAGMNVTASDGSMLAFDTEWAAYIVRVAATVGYVDEDAAWTYLRRIANRTRKHFVSWEGYFVSFVLAQPLLNANARNISSSIRTGIGLLNLESPFVEYQSPWRKHPLQCLPVLSPIDATAVRVA